ncbi:MAG: hypothetical protein IKU51_01995, partial [Clostridia bacterium]|nr:hypothetical protein [Clostridia bacterium]
MRKFGKIIISLLCAALLTVGMVAPALSATAERYLPWLQEDTLVEQILQRDGFIEGIWFPWFTHDSLGHGLTANEVMTKYVGQQWATVGIDDYGANKVYQEIYNLKVMGYNMIAYAGSAYGEGVVYDDNGDVLGIKREYLENIRRFLTMCRQIGMPVMWNICFHTSSVPDYYGMDAWWIINTMYGNPTVADHYAERFVRPLCQVLAEFPDVVAIVALTDEIENETNDSEIGNLFSGNRAMYGNNLDDIVYFVTAMNDVVKEEMPNTARTVAVNNVDKSRYGHLELDLNGHNTYNNYGNNYKPEDMVADAPAILSEYNVASAMSEEEYKRIHRLFRDNMKTSGYVGGFMWCWQPNDYGGTHSIVPANPSSVSDFREYAYDIRHYILDSQYAHRGTPNAIDSPDLFFNTGRGIVEWLPSRQAETIDLLSSTNGGATWKTLLDNVPQSDYVQGFKCVYKDRRATADTVYKVVARDAEGNTVESAPNNHPDVAVEFIKNSYGILQITESKPTVVAAQSAVTGQELLLSTFGEKKNRPLNEAANVIKNGSFEEAEGGQWNNATFLGGDVQVVEDPTAPDGSKSLYFDSSATTEAKWYTVTLDVDKNTDYVFSAWIKGAYIADDNRFYASIGVLNPSTRKFMVFQNFKDRASREDRQLYPTAWDNEWHLRSVSFNSGSQTQITIGLYGRSSKMWVDDIALHKAQQSTEYVSPNMAGYITATMTQDGYCSVENSLTENVQMNDSDSDYWQTGSGWHNGFMTVEDSRVGYGPSLKYKALNPTGIYYIKWVDVKPNTQYVFSASVKVVESGNGGLRLMTDKKAKPVPFYEMFFDAEVLGDQWTSIRTEFKSGVYTRIGIAVIDKGGEALIDNIRLFESQYAIEGEDEYVARQPLNGWVKEDGGWAYYEDDVKVANRWIKDSVGWCYLGADGYAVTNCFMKDSHGWCYLNGSGSMVKNNWVKDNGKWYFLDQNGYLVTNAWKKDSKGWVYVGSDGAMLTNAWCKDSQGWCYV